jgi:hypothetical protein
MVGVNGFVRPHFFRCALCLVLMGGMWAHPAAAREGRTVVCLLPLEHADAEHLAAVLSPLLSPQGTISAYAPTNTLIIKDRPSTVRMLVEAVKGSSDLSHCENWPPAPKTHGPRSGHRGE